MIGGALLLIPGANLALHGLPQGLTQAGARMAASGNLDVNGPTIIDPATGKPVNVFDKIGASGAGLSADADAAKAKFGTWFENSFGSEASRSAGFHQYMKSQGGTTTNINIKAQFDHKHDFDMDKLQNTTTTHVARQLVQAEQRAGA
jgi:hypothetical protein